MYLVPIGGERFGLYAEPTPEIELDGDAQAPPGFWRRQAKRFHEGWRDVSRAAHEARSDTSRLARARDWLVRKIADSVSDQQTLWSLRDMTTASFVYPADVSEASAAADRDRLLVDARRHHGIWLLVNLVAAAVAVILILLPGPNLIGYYFAFRVIGHFLSWRGARQALALVSWQPRAEPALTDLGRLAQVPRPDRDAQVAQIAIQLGLPRLQWFFDRAAAPGR